MHDSHLCQTTMSRTWSLERQPRRPSTATSRPDRHLRSLSSLTNVTQLSPSVPWCSLIPTPLVPLPVSYATSTRKDMFSTTAGTRTPKVRQRSHPLLLRLPTARTAGTQLLLCTPNRTREAPRAAEVEVEAVDVDADADPPSWMTEPLWFTRGRRTRSNLETVLRSPAPSARALLSRYE